MFIFLSSISFGQDFNKDFGLIVDKMNTAKSVEIDVEVAAYASKGGGRIYSTKAEMSRMGKNSRSVLGEMESIRTPEYELKLDSEEKAILIFDRSNEQEKLKQFGEMDFDVKALEKFFETQNKNKQASVSLKSDANGLKTYVFTGIPGLKEMIIRIRPKEGKIVSIDYAYNEASGGQFITLKYKTFEYGKDLTSVFDLTKYFTVNEGQYVLNQRLEGYHLYTER